MCSFIGSDLSEIPHNGHYYSMSNFFAIYTKLYGRVRL